MAEDLVKETGVTGGPFRRAAADDVERSWRGLIIHVPGRTLQDSAMVAHKVDGDADKTENQD